MAEHDLESLYREVQSALKSRDYNRASELLKQILVVDENYRDVSRLLAQTVKLKRRKWDNHPALWWTVIGAATIGLMVLVAPKLSQQTSLVPVPLTVSFTSTAIPTETLVPTIAPSPMPTAIPLMWKRISLGQDFERDAVTAFATDKNDADIIYAAMKNSGIYKTIDGGLSWFPSHHGLANTQVLSLVIDSENPGILYAGTVGGIFKTEDGGKNWLRIGNGTYLLMDWQDSSHIYARDENGIYETRDQGNGWETVYVLKQGCPGMIRSWAIHPVDGNMLFMGGGEDCEPGVYRSDNGGRSWHLIGMEGKPNLDPIAVQTDGQGGYTIHVGHISPLGVNLHGVYTSHDGGKSWSKSEGNFRCYIFAADVNDPSALYCANGSPTNIYFKEGVKASWKAIPGTYSKIYTAVLIDHPRDDITRIILGANDISTTSDHNIGIFISQDMGASWAQGNNGIGTGWAEFKIDPMDDTSIYLSAYEVSEGGGTHCKLYRSEDRGKDWQLVKWREGDWCGPAFDNAHVLYMVESSALQKSWDGGDTWWWDSQDLTEEERRLHHGVAAKYRLPSWEDEDWDSRSISANPFVDRLIYDVGHTIYYSEDSGATWSTSSGSNDLWDARLFYTNSREIIFGIGRYSQAYSTDDGKTWRSCGTGVTTSRSDSRMVLDPHGSRLYLATSGQGVLVSTDKCQSWQPSNSGLTNLFVNTVAIDPNDSNKIYAGTDSGAYISFDGGATWGQVNDGLLGATVVYSIAVDKESNVYAATPYGIFKLEGK